MATGVIHTLKKYNGTCAIRAFPLCFFCLFSGIISSNTVKPKNHNGERHHRFLLSSLYSKSLIIRNE